MVLLTPVCFLCTGISNSGGRTTPWRRGELLLGILYNHSLVEGDVVGSMIAEDFLAFRSVKSELLGPLKTAV
mgnify:FL=1